MATQATVWKFEWPLFPLSGVCTITMPRGAEVLHAAEQFGKVYLWARVDPAAPMEPRRFACCMTGVGTPTQADGHFIATLLLDSGAFVVHLFERLRQRGEN